MSIFIVTTDEYHLTDGKALKHRLATGERSTNVDFPVLPPGRHEFERIACPVRDGGPVWLVLKGTQTGMAERAWKKNDGTATVEEDDVAT